VCSERKSLGVMNLGGKVKMSRYHRVMLVGSVEEKIEMLEGEIDYASNRVREARKTHNEPQQVYWELKLREVSVALMELKTPALL